MKKAKPFCDNPDCIYHKKYIPEEYDRMPVYQKQNIFANDILDSTCKIKVITNRNELCIANVYKKQVIFKFCDECKDLYNDIKYIIEHKRDIYIKRMGYIINHKEFLHSIIELWKRLQDKIRYPKIWESEDFLENKTKHKFIDVGLSLNFETTESRKRRINKLL